MCRPACEAVALTETPLCVHLCMLERRGEGRSRSVKVSPSQQVVDLVEDAVPSVLGNTKFRVLGDVALMVGLGIPVSGVDMGCRPDISTGSPVLIGGGVQCRRRQPK